MKGARIYLWLFFASTIMGGAMAQWSAMQLPPSIRWREIRTGHFRIIYPSEADSLARRTAWFLENNYTRIGRGLTHKVRNTPVILNTYSAESNGYSSLAPRRTEWYMTPPPHLFAGNRAWYRDLAIHEYRHIVQFDAMNAGGIRLMKWWGGDAGQLIGMGMTYPLWFFEGDAVYTETVFDTAGRGRVGRFATPVKAIVTEYPPKQRNYYDFYYQSYKRYYPSHYHLGYYMVAYLHRHPGKVKSKIWLKQPQNIWDAVVKDAAWWYMVAPFGMHIALKSRRHLSYRQLADSTWAELDSIWHIRSGFQLPDGSYEIPHEPSPWSNDVYAHPMAGGQVFFLRYGFDTPPTIMAWRPGQKKARKIRQIPSYRFSAGGDWLAWIEYRPHPRWQNKVEGRAVLYNWRTGRRLMLRHHAKYNDIRLDAQGRKWVAIYYDSLAVPHLETGRVEDGAVEEDRAFRQWAGIYYPSFTPNGHIIFEGLSEEKGTGVYLWQPGKADYQTLMSPTRLVTRDWPRLTGDSSLIWTSDWNGVNVWEMNLASGRKKMLTQRPYEAFYPVLKGDTLWFSDYRKDGYHLVAVPRRAWKSLPRSAVSYKPEHYFVDVQQAHKKAVNLSGKISFDSIPSGRRYAHWKSWLKPHSWILMPLLVDQEQWQWAGGLAGSDLLNETFWMAGGLYQDAAHYGWFGSWEWRRWFPVLGLQWGREFQPDNVYTSWKAYVSLPLNLRHDIWNSSFSTTLAWSFYSDNFKTFEVAEWSGRYTLSRQRAYRDLQGSGVYASWAWDYEPAVTGKRFNMRGGLRTKGFLRHDYWQWDMWMMRQNDSYSKGFYYKPFATAPGGVYRQVSQIMLREETPIWYPDAGLKRVFRLKRLRGGPVMGWSLADGTTQYGAGFTITGDWNFFGFKVDVPLGVRAMYIWPLRRWTWGLEFSGIGF